jgi:hypothetical protein
MTLVATTPLTLLIKIIVNASEVLYFRISVTIFRFSFLIFTPFHIPPRGPSVKNCLVGNFSEGARLPRWPLLNLAPP